MFPPSDGEHVSTGQTLVGGAPSSASVASHQHGVVAGFDHEGAEGGILGGVSKPLAEGQLPSATLSNHLCEAVLSDFEPEHNSGCSHDAGSFTSEQPSFEECGSVGDFEADSNFPPIPAVFFSELD